MLLSTLLALSIWLAPYTLNTDDVDTTIAIHNLGEYITYIQVEWQKNCRHCDPQVMQIQVYPNRTRTVKMPNNQVEGYVRVTSYVQVVLDGWITSKEWAIPIKFTQVE